MSYTLESKKEFDRLEEQSKTILWDPDQELKSFRPSPGGVILDAGCGSGIVSRYMARRFPQAEIVGCDQSNGRIHQALEHSKEFKNISFQVENISALSFETSALDGILCRYVLEHLSKKNVQKTVSEMYRCLKPGGRVCLVDIDGYLHNIFPQTPVITKFLTQLVRRRPVDLTIGRKLPFYLSQCPFKDIDWSIQTLHLKGKDLETEIQLMKKRFEQTRSLAIKMLGSKKQALQYEKEYFEILQQPGTVLFYNKFIVTATKPTSDLRLIGKN